MQGEDRQGRLSPRARPVGRWLGKGLDVVERSADYLSNGINKVTRGIGRGIDWAEDKVGSAADWMAKKTRAFRSSGR